MRQIEVGPARLRGSVRAPPSKSYTHRELVASLLSTERSTLASPLAAEDTRRSRRALERLGRRLATASGFWVVAARRSSTVSSRRVTVDCGASGTTLRLLLAAVATFDREVRFVGSPRLGERPIAPLLDLLEAGGARIDRSREGGRWSVSVRGPITPGRFSVDLSESSQPLSAMMMALPVLAGPSSVRVRGPIVSRPYLDATVAVLGRRSVASRWRERRFETPGWQRYRGGRYAIPGDASSAAYLWAGAAISGGAVRIRGVPSDLPQADLLLLDLLERAGAEVVRDPDGALVRGAPLEGIAADLTDAPDLLPLVAVLAAVARGTSHIRGARHAALKESDRRRAAVGLARAIGARADDSAGRLTIEGSRRPRPSHLPPSDDHRVVMSAAIGALAAPAPSVVGYREAVDKSFPGFWAAVGGLGAPLRSVPP